MAPNRKVIFIGNPGVGKSTLLNCLLQEKAKFESGLSMAQGKTKFLQGYKAPSGITYYDTPGLSDVVLRKQAAEEIKKALLPAAGQQQSECQVFFVVTLEAGRVRPDDKVTINLVLEAAEEIGTNYSIIINKLPKNTYDKIMASDDIKYTLRTSLLDGLHFPTVSIYFSMKSADLDDQDNALVALSPDLLNFIHNSKPVPCITQVQDIDCDKYEKLANMLMEQLEEMKSDRAVLERKMQEQAERYKVLMKEQEKYLEQEKNRKTGFGEAVGVVLRPWKWFG